MRKTSEFFWLTIFSRLLQWRGKQGARAMDDLSKLIGRTVAKAEMFGDGYFRLTFEDGSELDVMAHGTEPQWLSVDFTD